MIVTKNKMSKELKNMYKSALISMNYFFLKIVFDKEYEKESKEKGIYDSVKCELKTLIKNIYRENLIDEITIAFKKELVSKKYILNKSNCEVKYALKKAIYNMFGFDDVELLNFYTNILI